jgi:type II secretory pathway component PulF
MLFSSRLPLSNLIELCRVLRHYLGAGIGLVQVFRQQASKGALAVRPVAGRIAAALEEGDDLETALKREADAFPPLFVSLARVGEQTGMMPEVFAELEKYYSRQQKLRRDFVARVTWPVIQFVLAVFVVAGLILIMGMLADRQGPGGEPLDPLGLGLSGPSGATLFLAVVFGSLAALGGLYLLLTRTLKHKASTDAFLLGLPAVGPCLRALALTRFCVALRLTTETGMAIARALRLSLRATGNQAFVAQTENISASVRAGDDLTLALARSGLFPTDFQHILAVAEESGRLSEVLQHQAEHYHEESGRRLVILTGVLSYGVWAFVGLLIIVAIFRIATWYVGLLNGA